MSDDEKRYIDTKLPLTWLLSSAVACILAVASLIWQLQINAIAINDAKTAINEIRILQAKYGDRISSLYEYDIDSRNQLSNIQAQIARLTIEFAELRKEQYLVNNKHRYMPLK